MIGDFIKNFDLFSQSIQFNSSKQSIRKRTFFGAFLSFLIIFFSLFYFIYLTIQYTSNQIEPKFRSQSFITNDDIDLPLTNRQVGFQIKQYRGDMSVGQLEQKQNKTYIVFKSYYLFKQGSNFTNVKLEIIPCEDPSLKDYLCLDFSKIPQQKITTGNNNGYKCQDTDSLKRSVPANCASPKEIDEYISNFNNVLSLKMFTSQYNTTSQSMQDNYKHRFSYLSSKLTTVLQFKAQKHITSIKQGILIQQEKQYSSAITYSYNSQALYNDGQNLTGYSNFFQAVIDVDETVQYIQIQYATFPEILAQCNSAITLMMCIGFLGRYFAQKLIKQELFIVILKTFYQETYQKILKLNNIQQFKDIYSENRILLQNKSKNEKSFEESTDPIFIPSLETKRGCSIFNQQNSQRNQEIDEIKEEQNFDFLQNSEINPKNAIQKDIFSGQDNKKMKRAQRQALKKNQFQNQNIKSDQFTIQSSPSSPYQTYSLKNSRKTVESDYNLEQNQINDKINSKQDGSIQKVIQRISCLSNNLISKKVEEVLFKSKIFNKNKYLESQGLDNKVIKMINEQICQSLDYISFYNEVMFLKKAILMILGKDQLAALKIVGCQEGYFNQASNENNLITGKKLIQEITLLNYIINRKREKSKLLSGIASHMVIRRALVSIYFIVFRKMQY